MFVVVFTRINAAIEIGEQFCNRFDTFIMLTRWSIKFLCRCQIAFFHCIGEGFSLLNQLLNFLHDINFVFCNRPHQRHCVSLYRGCAVGGLNNDFSFRITQQPTGHIVFARLKGCRHFLGEAWGDVFALFHHHDAFKDFPFQTFLAVVMHDELGFSGRNCERHRLTLFVIDRNFHLRQCVGGKCRGRR